MAFRKTYGRKTYYRRRYKKKNYNKSGWGNTARKALKIASTVAKMVNAETKYLDINLSPTASTYNGAIITLCNPTQGTNVNQREGDSIKMKNLTLRAQFKQNGTVQESIRMILFIDKQNNINACSDLLAAVGVSNAIYSPKLEVNKFDSKILWDKTYIISTDSPIKEIERVIKIGYHEQFVASSATLATNALKIAFISQSSLAGTTYAFYSRVTYYDN